MQHNIINLFWFKVSVLSVYLSLNLLLVDINHSEDGLHIYHFSRKYADFNVWSTEIYKFKITAY